MDRVGRRVHALGMDRSGLAPTVAAAVIVVAALFGVGFGTGVAAALLPKEHAGGRTRACRVPKKSCPVTTTSTSTTSTTSMTSTQTTTTTATTTTAATTTAATTTTPTTTTSSTTTDPSRVPMPAGDPPGWHRIFADDFTQDVPLGNFPAAVSSTWRAYPCCWKDTSGNGTYWPQKGISIHDGVMDLWLHTETVNGVTYHISEAPQPILPLPTRGQLYGRYVIRFKADPVQGYKTAWLLWPDDGNRAEGEIDFPETNTLDGGTTHAFVHPVDFGSQAAFNSGVPEAGAWHTAVMEWSPNDVKFLLDGVQIGESTTGIPSTLMHFVIQTETQMGGAPPPPDSASGHILIDWVAVYAPA
jgi:hypothetical protein